MSDTNPVEDPRIINDSDGGAPAAETSAPPAAKPKTKATKTPTRKSAKVEEEAKPAVKPRPAAPARPSIYESITNTAKKMEADRAARAAAQKANAASQSAAIRATAAG